MTGWVTVDTLVLPKSGHDAALCEDAVAVRLDQGSVTVAVADGATEAAYSRAWAQALVEGATGLEGACRLVEAVKEAQVPFSKLLEANRPDLPWYVAQKAQQGAYAALTRLCVERRSDTANVSGGTWHAEAVGDVTLFHLREAALLRAWPNESPLGFSTRPDLIHSYAAVRSDRVAQAEGTWKPGDTLCLATDALAAHLLGDPDDAARFAARARIDWEASLDEARAAGMKNDDVAFVRLAFDQS